MKRDSDSELSTTTLGESLRQARERAGLSQQDIAEKLHLSITLITDMEANRFSALGAPVYAKGYLRQYAALVGSPVEPLLERYAALEDKPAVADPIPSTMGHAPVVSRPVLGWVRMLWVLIPVAVLVWWLNTYRMVTPHTQPVAQQPADAVAVAPPIVPTAVTQPTAEVITTPAPAIVTEEPLVEPPVATDKVKLQLTFAQDSWSEVYDAQGKRLLYDLGAAGTTHVLEGKAPLLVVLGSADDVRLSINDKATTIPAMHTKKSVARFKVLVDGSLD